MTNLEYINSLPCSQRLKDRIAYLNQTLNSFNTNNAPYYNSIGGIADMFIFHYTDEGKDYWMSINDSIINNTPIVE